MHNGSFDSIFSNPMIFLILCPISPPHARYINERKHKVCLMKPKERLFLPTRRGGLEFRNYEINRPWYQPKIFLFFQSSTKIYI